MERVLSVVSCLFFLFARYNQVSEASSSVRRIASAEIKLADGIPERGGEITRRGECTGDYSMNDSEFFESSPKNQLNSCESEIEWRANGSASANF